MPTAPADPGRPRAHRAPALWVAVLGIVATVAVAVVRDARSGLAVLTVVLVSGAVARLVGGDRRPEGLAVRSVWVDVAVLTTLGLGVGLLALSPSV